MDHARPLRRLLPVGVLSAAGLAGCCTALPYRPVTTSQPPAQPAATASPAPSVPPQAAAPATVNPDPAANGNPVAAAPPDAPPSTSPAPPPPVDLSPPSGVSPSAPGASGQTDLNLNAPMGVLQTPLPSPPASALPTENAPTPPEAPAPNAPLAAPPQVGVSVSVGAGAAPAPVPAKKPAAQKPSAPIAPPSPLARLRKRFHDWTHPSKPDPKKEGDALTASAKTGTKTPTAITGDRFPLPTTNVGVALHVDMPPMHPLYVSDDVPRAQPLGGGLQTAQVETSASPVSGPPPIPPAATTVAAQSPPSAAIEQWPYSPGATSTPVAATAESSDDFTAIPSEEYRAAVAKLGPANGTSATSQPAGRPSPAPASSEQAQSFDPQLQERPASPRGASANSPAAQATTMIVIPQAATRAQRMTQSATPAGSDQQSLPSAVSAASSSPNMSAGAVQAASLPNTNAPTQIPNQIPNQESAGAFPSGWSMPSSGAVRPVTTTSATVVAPVAPQGGAGSFAQPGEMPPSGGGNWVPIRQAAPSTPRVSALPAAGVDSTSPPANPSAAFDGAQGGS